MIALIAAVLAVAVITVMWRFLDTEAIRREQASPGSMPEREPAQRRATPRRKPATRIIAPDDDPEFLRELGKQIHKNRDDEQPV